MKCTTRKDSVTFTNDFGDEFKMSRKDFNKMGAEKAAMIAARRLNVKGVPYEEPMQLELEFEDNNEPQTELEVFVCQTSKEEGDKFCKRRVKELGEYCPDCKEDIFMKNLKTIWYL